MDHRFLWICNSLCLCPGNQDKAQEEPMTSPKAITRQEQGLYKHIIRLREAALFLGFYSTNRDKSLIRNQTIGYMHKDNNAMFTEIFAYQNLLLYARTETFYWNCFRSDCANKFSYKVSLCIKSMRPIVNTYYQQVLIVFLRRITFPTWLIPSQLDDKITTY